MFQVSSFLSIQSFKSIQVNSVISVSFLISVISVISTGKAAAPIKMSPYNVLYLSVIYFVYYLLF